MACLNQLFEREPKAWDQPAQNAELGDSQSLGSCCFIKFPIFKQPLYHPFTHNSKTIIYIKPWEIPHFRCPRIIPTIPNQLKFFGPIGFMGGQEIGKWKPLRVISSRTRSVNLSARRLRQTSPAELNGTVHSSHANARVCGVNSHGTEKQSRDMALAVEFEGVKVIEIFWKSYLKWLYRMLHWKLMYCLNPSTLSGPCGRSRILRCGQVPYTSDPVSAKGAAFSAGSASHEFIISALRLEFWPLTVRSHHIVGLLSWNYRRSCSSWTSAPRSSHDFEPFQPHAGWWLHLRGISLGGKVVEAERLGFWLKSLAFGGWPSATQFSNYTLNLLATQ